MLNEYSSATLALSARVEELVQKTVTLPKAEYTRLHEAAEQARVTAEQAHLKLEKHVAEHGCASVMAI